MSKQALQTYLQDEGNPIELFESALREKGVEHCKICPKVQTQLVALVRKKKTLAFMKVIVFFLLFSNPLQINDYWDHPCPDDAHAKGERYRKANSVRSNPTVFLQMLSHLPSRVPPPPPE
jgi:hypothetical protein